MHIHYEQGSNRIFIFTPDQERLLKNALVKYGYDGKAIIFQVKKGSQEGTMIIHHESFDEIREDHTACLAKVKEIIGEFVQDVELV